MRVFQALICFIEVVINNKLDAKFSKFKPAMTKGGIPPSSVVSLEIVKQYFKVRQDLSLSG